jgi:MacB-like protein
MTWLRMLLARVRGLFRKETADSELSAEIQAHLEMLAEEYRRQGMAPEEARQAALREFGGVAQAEEAYRQQRGVYFLETLLQDLRYAVRMLRRTPGFTAVVVISLALGIGANTAIFSAIDAVMLRMLPVADPQQLVMVEWHAKDWPEKYVGDLEGSSLGEEGKGITSYSFNYPAFQQFKEQNHVFEETFAFAANSDAVNVGIDGRAEATSIQGVSGTYFAGLGVLPVQGRMIVPDDDRESASPVAVVSYNFWQQRLGAAQVAGKSLVLNGRPITVIGVAPPEFFGLEPGGSPGLYIPLTQYSAEQARQGGSGTNLTYVIPRSGGRALWDASNPV